VQKGPLRGRRRLAVPEPEVLKKIGDESRRNGTITLGLRQISRIIKAARGNRGTAEPVGRKY